jgi:hypothetical protein
MKKINLILFGLTLSLGLIISLSSFRNSFQTTTETTGPLFEDEEVQTITCDAVTWSKTTFYGATGAIVGTTETTGGKVTASYTGTYKSSTTESGTIPGRQATMTNCVGWGWGCHKITAAEACE